MDFTPPLKPAGLTLLMHYGMSNKLAKRIIPCLDVKNGRTVKGINFIDLRDAGDPVSLAEIYSQQGADELIFLDISATLEGRTAMLHVVQEVAAKVSIPFTVGGGINTVEDAAALLEAGADRISVNSAAVKNIQLVRDLNKRFGRQCVVVAVDSKNIDGIDWVHTHGGSKKTELETVDWCKTVAQAGAGEILLTSMDSDGTKKGFAVDLLKRVANAVQVPVIASGGAGNAQHFEDVFKETNVGSALAASIFHFGEVLIPDLKAQLADKGITVRI